MCWKEEREEGPGQTTSNQMKSEHIFPAGKKYQNNEQIHIRKNRKITVSPENKNKNLALCIFPSHKIQIQITCIVGNLDLLGGGSPGQAHYVLC